MACIHRDAGTMTTVMLMHLPVTRGSVQEGVLPTSSATRKSTYNWSSLATGKRAIAPARPVHA